MTHWKCGGKIHLIPDPPYLTELKSKPYPYPEQPRCGACDRCGLRGELYRPPVPT